MKPLTIGRLAQLADVNIETIRYYQRIGLLNEPLKPASGFRQYPQTSIETLHFIKRAKQMGFSLQEIAELIELGESACSSVRLRAEAKREQISTQIQELKGLRQTLDQLIKQCQSKKKDRPCPIVQKLSH